MKKLNLNNVQEAGGYNRLPAGGYVCAYTDIQDYPVKEYLKMEFDIAEGEYVGYFKELNDHCDFWAGRCYRSYKEKALPMFKRMCSAVTKSNNDFIFDGDTNSDETTLIGKKVGIVLGEEEYEANNGEVKTRLYVVRECSVDDIHNGNYKVPEKKCLQKPLEAAGNEGFMQVTGDEGIPW